MRWSRLLNDFIRSQALFIFLTYHPWYIGFFVLIFVPTWWPNAYHSSQSQDLAHDKKEEEGREDSKNGFSLGNLFISQGRENVLRSPLMDSACYLIDQTCSHGLTALQVVLGKQLFQPLHWREARIGMIYAWLSMYMNVCIYILVGEDYRSFCMSFWTSSLPAL